MSQGFCRILVMPIQIECPSRSMSPLLQEHTKDIITTFKSYSTKIFDASEKDTIVTVHECWKSPP